MSWKNDKQWSDRFLPEIKVIVGQWLLKAAPEVEDMQRNTDLVVLKMEAVRIACRVRTHGYLMRYPNDFTIRASRDSGNQTELEKIIESFGRYLFYGFADATESHLEKWFIGDLNVFRRWWAAELARLPSGEQPGKLIRNHDGSGEFRAFSVFQLPPEFIATSSTRVELSPQPPPVAKRKTSGGTGQAFLDLRG